MLIGVVVLNACPVLSKPRANINPLKSMAIFFVRRCPRRVRTRPRGRSGAVSPLHYAHQN